jgi:hypothetical protein
MFKESNYTKIGIASIAACRPPILNINNVPSDISERR